MLFIFGRVMKNVIVDNVLHSVDDSVYLAWKAYHSVLQYVVVLNFNLLKAKYKALFGKCFQKLF